MAPPVTHHLTVDKGCTVAAPALLGHGPTRVVTAGKIRAGIKVLSRKAAQSPQAQAIYEQGVAAGQSFDQIERAINDALPGLPSPLVPRNVQWFTVRAQDFVNPLLAEQILSAFGEDRGEGLRLYRFPVLFPSDHWQTVMPHELAAWGSHGKQYWSLYTADGRSRQCMAHAPVPVDETGHRTVRLFGGRKPMLRESNHGICEPEICPEYQQRQCNLSGRLVFFIPGIRCVSAFELPTNSFYAMNNAIRTFETVSFLRGGRISGFLDRQRTPFYLTKTLREVAYIDEQGRAVRVPQWIIELEAPVDVGALLRENEDTEATLTQARLATQILEVGDTGTDDDLATGDSTRAVGPATTVTLPADLPAASPAETVHPTLAQLLACALSAGIAPDLYQAYARRRWGPGWKLNPQGRLRAWEELERYRNDPQGYLDKIESELQVTSCRRTP